MAYKNVENIAPANGPTTGIQKKNLFAVNTSDPYKKSIIKKERIKTKR
jgi:hypothetical protein